MSLEFGRKGPDGIRGEGATGYDELRHVPYQGESGLQTEMTKEAEEMRALLDSIDTEDQEDGIGTSGEKSGELDTPVIDAETEALLKRLKEAEEESKKVKEELRAIGIDPDNLGQYFG